MKCSFSLDLNFQLAVSGNLEESKNEDLSQQGITVDLFILSLTFMHSLYYQGQLQYGGGGLDTLLN